MATIAVVTLASVHHIDGVCPPTHGGDSPEMHGLDPDFTGPYPLEEALLCRCALDASDTCDGGLSSTEDVVELFELEWLL